MASYAIAIHRRLFAWHHACLLALMINESIIIEPVIIERVIIELVKLKLKEGTLNPYDFTVIGGGIVGVATALEITRRYPNVRIALIEKERGFAAHQTGHNSGVVHAGVYYQPGSLKASLCKRGAELTRQFCLKHCLPFRKTGKLLVATAPLEWKRMTALKDRCHQNQIDTLLIDYEGLKKMEPNITGLGALLVPATAITDYARITQKMADLFMDAGGTVIKGRAVTGIREDKDLVALSLGQKTITTRYLLTCGGLQADRLARMAGIDIDFQIIPFRGEYYQLPASRSRIVTRLIYPIPDPDLPFLGVHLTPMISGQVTV